MTYQVTITRSAKKDLDRLPARNRDQLIRSAFALTDNPRPHNSIKMAGPSGDYRLKVGKYRIIYAIDDANSRWSCG